MEVSSCIWILDIWNKDILGKPKASLSFANEKDSGQWS